MLKLGSKRIAAAALIGTAPLEAADARGQDQPVPIEPGWMGTSAPDLPPPSSQSRRYAANLAPQIGGRVAYTSGSGSFTPASR
jgi:hypothetical protein